MRREICIDQATFTSKNSPKQLCWLFLMWEDNKGWEFFTRGRIIMDYGCFGQEVIGSESGLRSERWDYFPLGVGHAGHWRQWGMLVMCEDSGLIERKCTALPVSEQINQPLSSEMLSWNPQKNQKPSCVLLTGKNDKTVLRVLCQWLFLKLFLDCLCFCNLLVAFKTKPVRKAQNFREHRWQSIAFI